MREKLRAQTGNRLYSGKGKFVGRLFAYLHVGLHMAVTSRLGAAPALR